MCPRWHSTHRRTRSTGSAEDLVATSLQLPSAQPPLLPSAHTFPTPQPTPSHPSPWTPQAQQAPPGQEVLVGLDSAYKTYREAAEASCGRKHMAVRTAAALAGEEEEEDFSKRLSHNQLCQDPEIVKILRQYGVHTFVPISAIKIYICTQTSTCVFFTGFRAYFKRVELPLVISIVLPQNRPRWPSPPWASR